MIKCNIDFGTILHSNSKIDTFCTFKPRFGHSRSRCFASPFGFDYGLRPPLRMTRGVWSPLQGFIFIRRGGPTWPPVRHIPLAISPKHFLKTSLTTRRFCAIIHPRHTKIRGAVPRETAPTAEMRHARTLNLIRIIPA